MLYAIPNNQVYFFFGGGRGEGWGGRSLQGQEYVGVYDGVSKWENTSIRIMFEKGMSCLV